MLLVLTAPLGCAACEWVEARKPPPLASMEYSADACLGECPVYKVTVAASGDATFEGLEHTALKGRKAFRISPATFRAFADAAAPLRPQQGDRDFGRCEHVWEDGSGATIVWHFADGSQQKAYVYSGCYEDYPNALRTIAAARAKLPIDQFIGGDGASSRER